jgi:hypothetical protein
MVSGQTVECHDAVAGHGDQYEQYIYLTCILTNTSTQDVSQEIFAFDRTTGHYDPPTKFDITGQKF